MQAEERHLGDGHDRGVVEEHQGTQIETMDSSFGRGLSSSADGIPTPELPKLEPSQILANREQQNAVSLGLSLSKAG